MTRRRSRLLAVLLAIALSCALLSTARAQIDPEVRDRIMPAAVRIAIVLIVEDQSGLYGDNIPVGSGTVITPDGLILTSAHVVDVLAHRATFDLWEEQAAEQGETLQVSLASDRFLISIPDASGRPQPAFFAALVAEDREQDLALLQAVEDLELQPLGNDALALAFVPLGDSDTVALGDPIDIFGYPAMTGGSLTYTTGVVSGFNFENDSDRRTWINTDATLSGGSSGGTAVNRAGELIGVPTQGSLLDCRPGDTNLDGQVTVEDVGCVPIGGSFGQIRPMNFARELLNRTGLPVLEVEANYEEISYEEFLAQMQAEAAARGISLVDKCATSPLYSPGTVVEAISYEMLWTPITEQPLPIGYIVPGTQLEIVGPVLESGFCDSWPVQILHIPTDVAPEKPWMFRAEVGTIGRVYELVFLAVDFRIGPTGAVMYQHSDTNSTAVVFMEPQIPVQELDNRTGWVLVEAPGGLIGWIQASDLIAGR